MTTDSTADSAAIKRIAVVTGGGSGIGRAAAHKLASKGFSVVISGRRLGPLQQTAAAYPDQIEVVQSDVSTVPGRGAIVAAVDKRPVAALVQAAGIFTTEALQQITQTAWEQTFATNVTARLFLAQALSQQLSEGRILFIGSRSATTARKGAMAYCSSQAASQMLQLCLKAELKALNIVVTSLTPGPVDTHIMQEGISANPAIYPDTLQQRQEALIAPDTVGEFIGWLLLDTTNETFSASQWDIRDSQHHPNWLQKSSLYEV